MRVGLDTRRAILLDRGDVEDGQQVDMRQTGLGQLMQAAHAIRVLLCEGAEGASIFRRHRRIGHAEVTNMQLVQHNVLGRVELRLVQALPPVGHQGGIVEVDDLAALAVRREAQRIRIGDEIALDPACRAHKDLHLVQVIFAFPAGRSLDTPDAGPGIVLHVDRSSLARGRGVVEYPQLDRLSSRRPQTQHRRAAVEGDAEGTVVAVQVVQHAGNLEPGRVDHPAVAVDRRDHDLPSQRLSYLSLVIRCDRERRHAPEVRELVPDGFGRALPGARQADLLPAGNSLRQELDACPKVVVQPVGVIVRHGDRPQQGVARDPVGASGNNIAGASACRAGRWRIARRFVTEIHLGSFRCRDRDEDIGKPAQLEQVWIQPDREFAGGANA